MENPANLKYTNSHEWARLEADGTITVGITDHAQEALGDIVFLDFPKVGQSYDAAENCAVVESVKAASDIYMPVAGEVFAVNDALGAAPEQLNADAFAAWLFKIKPANAADLGGLLDAAAYSAGAGK